MARCRNYGVSLWRTALTVAACALSVLLGPHAQSLHADETAGGSLLRQVNTASGHLPELVGWESLMLPESVRDQQVLPASFDTPAAADPAFAASPGWGETQNEWTSPYQMTEKPFEHEREWEGWYTFLPENFIPWGPRTPYARRHRGLGMPLEGTSWMNRPLSAGWGAGVLWGDNPIDNRISLIPAFYGIYRVGWDYDYHWGLEVRLGQASAGVEDLQHHTFPRTADLTLFDTSILWYPWGDSRVRPYMCAGIGFQHFNFWDDNALKVDETSVSTPIGIGVKYLATPWIVFRVEATNNIAWGGGSVDTMHNLSVNGGVEIRFGGRRPSYWPWNPNKVIW